MTRTGAFPIPPLFTELRRTVERAFREAFFILDRRIGLFLSLPLASLDGLALKKEVDNIGDRQ